MSHPLFKGEPGRYEDPKDQAFADSLWPESDVIVTESTIIKRFAIWLARWAGAVLVERPAADVMAAAHEFAKHVASQKEPWEWKQRQVLRAMRNRFPKIPVRDLNLAIEIAVQECSASDS